MNMLLAERNESRSPLHKAVAILRRILRHRKEKKDKSVEFFTKNERLNEQARSKVVSLCLEKVLKLHEIHEKLTVGVAAKYLELSTMPRFVAVSNLL